MAASPASSIWKNISTSRRSGSRPARRLNSLPTGEWRFATATPLPLMSAVTFVGTDMNFPLLFSPLQVGPYRLGHRVVMAPLTRMRAEKPGLAPRPLNAEYYGQRATPGGLIIAEASPVMATGHGSPGTPGIYSEAQIKGWRGVVDAVHAKGGLIFL